MPYEPGKIDAKWQSYWLEQHTFGVDIDPNKPKFYVLDMFPYPSGEGLHVGHPKGYVATDIYARYMRMKGFNVLHPMGWDAFGLPAEQHAVETGQHPRETTAGNVRYYKQQLQALGLSYDWEREIDTTDPSYVKWTQWIFSKLFELGLAYEAEVPVNWCPALGTVLANEEVIGGKSERGGHPVVRLPLRQWMLKITAYAQRLLDDLELVDWPEHIKKMQRDWIGRSEGARVSFPVQDGDGASIEIFTTRPDTLFGATYMVLAPEHELVDAVTTVENREAVAAYIESAARKSERVRMADLQSKTGVFTGGYAINPVNGESIPIWVADYVLISYGTGAIMAVPGHDERDYAFARTFDLPIVEVVSGGDISERAYAGEGVSVNSGILDGLPTAEAKTRICSWLAEQGAGEAAVSYKLRDWLFSRQRYWGEPFPVLHLEDGSIKLVPESDLPVRLPELEDYRPSGDFEPPLARVGEWIATTDPETGAPARRDANTMPQWAGSSWYFLRYCDPHNDEALISPEAERYWMNVDLYVGGAEHAVLHLLYSRFWHKVLFDLGVVSTKEPFQKLLNPGMIQGKSYRFFSQGEGDSVKYYSASDVRYDGEVPVHVGSGEELSQEWVKAAHVRWVDGQAVAPDVDVDLEEVVERMAKSRGNVVNPDDVIAEYGADAMRLYEMFIGPLEKAAPWSTEGMPGVFRFLQRMYRLFTDESDAGRELEGGTGSKEQQRLLAKTVDRVTQDCDTLSFNTAISQLMVFVRDIEKKDPMPRWIGEAALRLLAPLAPHLAEELWQRLGHSESIAYEPWPEADEAHLVDEEIEVVVQVQGKVRAKIRVAADADEDSVREAALAQENVQKHLGDQAPRRVIYVPGRLVNVVL